MSSGNGQSPHVARLYLDSIVYSLERGIPHRNVAGIAGLIVRAPQVDARDPAAAQPSRDGDEYGAAPAAHVEHAFVAAQVQPVEDFLPDLELAAPGGVEKTGGVSQEETGIQRHAWPTGARCRSTTRRSPRRG